MAAKETEGGLRTGMAVNHGLWRLECETAMEASLRERGPRNRSRTWSESGWDLGQWGCSKSVVQTREMRYMIGDFFKF